MENIIFQKHTSGILVITIAQPEIKVSNNEKKKNTTLSKHFTKSNSNFVGRDNFYTHNTQIHDR